METCKAFSSNYFHCIERNVIKKPTLSALYEYITLDKVIYFHTQ